jgi:hypothetical protein
MMSSFDFQGEENMGMAMTFTLVSHLREQLSSLVVARVEARNREEHEKERLAIEVSNREKKTRRRDRVASHFFLSRGNQPYLSCY